MRILILENLKCHSILCSYFYELAYNKFTILLEKLVAVQDLKRKRKTAHDIKTYLYCPFYFYSQ